MHALSQTVTVILLNSPDRFGSSPDNPILAECLHPDFDRERPEALKQMAMAPYISAFNMVTERGQNLFKACVEFLAARYTRPDAKYGAFSGMIISNEITTAYVWGNAGSKSCEQYCHEYTRALRLAWLAGRKHCAHFRVYVSLDMMWNTPFSTLDDTRFYRGRDIIENLNTFSKAYGDFPWCVAYHPYPEDLRYPDFYNDRRPDFSFSTDIISFKNIEVLAAYLKQSHLTYRGQARRIILSEQGFNSRGTAVSEKQAAAAYCLAYMKARNIDLVDMMTHHAYVDNKYEFGLNLGIRRRNDDGSVGEPKPIYNSVRDMDTPAEAACVAAARAFIGPELFDEVLHPQLILGDADHSHDGDF